MNDTVDKTIYICSIINICIIGPDFSVFFVETK